MSIWSCSLNWMWKMPSCWASHLPFVVLPDPRVPCKKIRRAGGLDRRRLEKCQLLFDSLTMTFAFSSHQLVPWEARSVQQIVLGFEGRRPWLRDLRSRMSSHGTWLQFCPYRATGRFGFLRPQGRNDGYRLIVSWLLCPPAFVDRKEMLLKFCLLYIINRPVSLVSSIVIRIM